MVVQPL